MAKKLTSDELAALFLKEKADNPSLKHETFYAKHGAIAHDLQAVVDKIIDEKTSATYSTSQDIDQKANYTMGEYDVPTSIVKEANEKIKDPQLLQLIKEELDTKHIRDDKEKMFAYLMTRTAFLPNPRDRKSIALVGDSSTGKDNLMDTIFHFTPLGAWEKFTNATTPTLEDEIASLKLIGFSEVNVHRQGGANADLVETLKQIAEGGVNSMKKDAATGFKTTKKTHQEQKSMVYSTTEDKKDDELATRYSVLTIKADEKKHETVNNNTLVQSSDPRAIVEKYQMHEINWLSVAHLMLEPLEVVLPSNETLCFESGKFFDSKNPRSQRDLKRLVCLAKAIAWLHQKQRPIIQFEGTKMVVGSPADFINALAIGGSFFDISYLGVDERAKKVFDYLKEKHPNESVSKKQLRMELGISRNTLTKRLEALEDAALIELEPQGPGRDTMVKPAQDLPNTWSKPAQKNELIKKLVSFDGDGWINKIKHVERVVDGSCTGLGHLLYDVKTGTCSKKLQDAYSDAFQAKNCSEEGQTTILQSNFEQVEIEQVKVDLLFLKEVPAWKGADGQTYGPFKVGEESELPAIEAAWAIKAGVAKSIEGD